MTCGGDYNPLPIIGFGTTDPVFADDALHVTGSGCVPMKIEGGVDMAAAVQRNKITGAGIVINPGGSEDASVIEQDVISSGGTSNRRSAAAPFPPDGLGG